MKTELRTRVMVGLVVAGCGILVAANVHLVWTSVQSQPDCVPHHKTAGATDRYQAAKSSC